jgi:hypothetical protein
MKTVKALIALLPLLCATSAFAGERLPVDIPFSFVCHGKLFPASQYEVEVSYDRYFLSLSSVETRGIRIPLVASRAFVGSNDAELSIRFDSDGGVHQLRSVRLGTYQAQISKPRMEAH